MTPESRIVPASEQSIDDAALALADGKLVGIPTETVYGLAANAWNENAVRQIFKAKGRPATNPLIVHVASIERLADAVAMPLGNGIQQQIDAVSDRWPGPLTVVCPRSSAIPDIVTAGQPTVAVRIPSHPVALSLLERCDFPLAAPSANRSNYISPTTAAHVSSLCDSVAMILDGGPCLHGVESTIIRCDSSGPVLLRPGAVTYEELHQRFAGIGLRLDVHLSGFNASENRFEAKLAPGMMKRHYSPRTPLRLVNRDREPDTVRAKTVRIAFEPLRDDLAKPYTKVVTLSETRDLDEVARALFATLRELDQHDYVAIDCDTCEETGIGRAIMDRLRRASSASIEELQPKET